MTEFNRAKTRTQLYGYLVAYQHAHHLDNWQWIAFTSNLYNAGLIAKAWGKGKDPECSACGIESVAHIFAWPPE